MKYNISRFFFCFLVIIVRRRKKKKFRDGAKWLFVIKPVRVCVCCFCYTHSCIEYYISRSYFVFFLFFFGCSFVCNQTSQEFCFHLSLSILVSFWLYVEVLIAHHGWIIKRIGFTWHGTEWNCVCPVFSLPRTPPPPHQPSKKTTGPRALFS